MGITPKDPADYAPGMGSYTDLKPFRFWCQKVLPLVYDDSLSYYEVLCKVVDYLNKSMEDVGVLHDDVEALNTAYQQLQAYVNDYFSTLDVQQEINNKLDVMAADGTLDALLLPYFNAYKGEINQIVANQNQNISSFEEGVNLNLSQQNNDIAALSARMDTFAQLTPGSTTGDAELADIRVAYNGATYSTAGDAVRAQAKGLVNEIDLNGFLDGQVNTGNRTAVLPLRYVQGGFVGSSSESLAANRIKSGFINLSQMTSLHIEAAAGYLAQAETFDVNRGYLAAYPWDDDITSTNWVNAKYIRIMVKKSDDSNLLPSDGSNITVTATMNNIGVTVHRINNPTNFYTGEFAKNSIIFCPNITQASQADLPQSYIDKNILSGLFFENIIYDTSNGYIEQKVNNNSMNEEYYRVITTAGNVIRAWTSAGGNSYKFYSAYTPDNLHSGHFAENSIVFCGLVSGSAVNELPDAYRDASATSSLFFFNTIWQANPVTLEQFIFSNSMNEVYYRVVTNEGAIYRSWTKFLGTGGGGSSGSPKNKWYVLGDSISAGYFSVTDEEAEEKGYTISYRPPGLSGVGAVWDPSLSHNYWGYANNWFLHRTLMGNAYPGQGFIRKAANNQNGIDVVKNTDLSDAGLITVAWGFNDWHYNMVRGDHNLIDANVPYPTEGYDTTQLTTINHAIWYCLGELIRKAPNAKIIVQTPMNGWLYGGDWASNWGMGYTLNNSGKLSDIHDDIKYWADYYQLQVLEMSFNNSMVNRSNIKAVMIDGSHPTDLCHQQLGRHVSTLLGYC